MPEEKDVIEQAKSVGNVGKAILRAGWRPESEEPQEALEEFLNLFGCTTGDRRKHD